MNRNRTRAVGLIRAVVVALLGTLVVLGGVAVAVAASVDLSAWLPVLVAASVLGGVVLAVWKLRRDPDAVSGTAAPPWSRDGELVRGTPERTPEVQTVSGTVLAKRVETAAAVARESQTVEEGFEVVRPDLRAALVEALVVGGRDRETAAELLATGEWTDDHAAASVLDAGVDPPAQSLRERILGWLFPERVVRRRVGRAVEAIGVLADEEVPSLVGENAPRTVPVTTPTLEDLNRAADGSLRRATQPLERATAHGATRRSPEDADRPDEPGDPGGAVDSREEGKR